MMSMGELYRRLDKHDCELIAKNLIEMWLHEFVSDYSDNGGAAVKKWFGTSIIAKDLNTNIDEL